MNTLVKPMTEQCQRALLSDHQINFLNSELMRLQESSPVKRILYPDGSISDTIVEMSEGKQWSKNYLEELILRRQRQIRKFYKVGDENGDILEEIG